MKQVSLFLIFLFVALSDAWFLDWFKSKKPVQTYGYPSPNSYGGGYSYYRPQQYKVPVWQAMPSGYPARPVQQGSGSYNVDTGNGNYGLVGTYANGVSGSYVGSSAASYGNVAPLAPNYQVQQASSGNQAGFLPVYEVTAPVYGGEAGNINVPATGNTDYTGSKPLLSVPVYFPKGTTYSNGATGFYDGSVAGSNAINYVQPSGQ